MQAVVGGVTSRSGGLRAAGTLAPARTEHHTVRVPGATRPRAPVAQGIEHRSPKAGVGSSNLPRRTEVLLQVRGDAGGAAATGIVSDLSGIGQRVVSDLSQDVDGLSRTWTDAGGRRR